MQEIWKPVKGFEEYFEISNLGRIKRTNAIITTPTCKKKIYKGIILKTSIDKGYEKINLSVNGKRKIKYIHRLVAEAFIPNENNYKEVNHIDSNTTNNRVDNLEWCNRKYNLEYMANHQKQITERHEKRIEALEMISYIANTKGSIDKDTINLIIGDELLGDY